MEGLVKQLVFTWLLGSLLVSLAGCGEETVNSSTGDTSGNSTVAAGTITFWIRPDWAGDIDSKISILHLGANTWENRLDTFKDLRYLRLLFTPTTGYETGMGTDISDWQKSDWHMVTATWGDGIAALYIDGVEIDTRKYDGELEIGPDPPLTIDRTGGALSHVTNVQFYSRALSANEVTALFGQPPR